MFEINPLIFICARYEDGTWSGTVQECGKLEPREFYSWADLAKKIDMYAANRSLVTELDKYYKPGGVWADTMLPKHRKGDLRLWVEIIACQHGTWQGRTACKGDGYHYFKSESEFLTLMQAACNVTRAETLLKECVEKVLEKKLAYRPSLRAVNPC